MSAGERPPCPGCGGEVRRGAIFCGVCWTDVPAAARNTLDRASKAMGKNPASRRVRENYAIALADCAGYVR